MVVDKTNIKSMGTYNLGSLPLTSKMTPKIKGAKCTQLERFRR